MSLLPFNAEAAAWLQKAGDIQVIANVFLYSTDEAFNLNGDRRPVDRFTKIEFNPYIEWGYSDDITLGVSQSFQNLRQSGDDNSAMGDAEIFLRTKLWEGEGKVLSIQPLIKLAGPYDPAMSLAPGNGQMDAELRLLYGQSFSYLNRHHFYNLEAAYRKRFETPADEIRFDATLGLRYNDQLVGLFQLYNTFSTGTNKGTPFRVTNSSNYDLTKAQVSVVWSVDRDWSIQAGAFSHIMGKNTGAGEGLVLSLWREF